MPWFENLNKAYQLAVIVGFACTIIASMLSTAVAVSIFAIDYRVDKRLRPLAMMMEFQFEKFGLDTEFEEYKARREKQEKTFGGLSQGRDPDPWLRQN